MQIELHPHAEQVLRKLMEQQGVSSPENAVNALILQFDSKSLGHNSCLPDPPILDTDETIDVELPRIPRASQATVPTKSRLPDYLD